MGSRRNCRGVLYSSPVNELPPAGLTWAEYIARWVDDCGGWLPLADQLIHRAGDAVEMPPDPQTVERGLRRLSRREHQDGGQYGRWMLRFFGFTSPIEKWVKWLGTGHTRFSDLPSSLRLEQLRLWNRAPIADSPLACWILVGIASAHHSRMDFAACEHWLERAERLAPAAGPVAEIETALLRAQLEIANGERDAARKRHGMIEGCLAVSELALDDKLPFIARLVYQRGSLYARPGAGVEPDFVRARDRYAAIPDSTIPFVSFHKSVGLAYCAWKLGELDTAARLARRAIDDAGDGGLVRMRVMALNMLSRILDGDEATAVNDRARRMATALEDEDLLRRVAQCVPVADT